MTLTEYQRLVGGPPIQQTELSFAVTVHIECKEKHNAYFTTINHIMATLPE